MAWRSEESRLGTEPVAWPDCKQHLLPPVAVSTEPGKGRQRQSQEEGEREGILSRGRRRPAAVESWWPGVRQCPGGSRGSSAEATAAYPGEVARLSGTLERAGGGQGARSRAEVAAGRGGSGDQRAWEPEGRAKTQAEGEAVCGEEGG